MSAERQAPGDRRTSPYLLKPVRSLEEARAERRAAQAGPPDPAPAERVDNDRLNYTRARR